MPSLLVVPDAMLRKDRAAHQEFDDSEMLYYRLKQPCGEIGDHPIGLDMEYPDFSVNRQKHGGLRDFVLIPNWKYLGIAEFAKGSIPGPDFSEGNIEYSWGVTHIPLDENYHHSEIWTYKGGTHCQRSSQVNKIVFRRFRQRISEAMTITKKYDKPAQAL
jgi:hypothetical protein